MTVKVVKGADLLKQNFPLIHAVGQASARPPRLIDMRWGKRGAPRLTLVGKGVAFDTGGLDIKPASGMRNMKKDMGGAANVLALAGLIVDMKLDVRLRVLIPAVENAIAGNAFRPGDIFPSRKGLTVEIGNTDAEGRLVLADALTLADEEKPDLIIDMATLTGAARVALGPTCRPSTRPTTPSPMRSPRLAPIEHDPLWRMPLWAPYAKGCPRNVADSATSRPTAWPARSRRRCSCSVSSPGEMPGRISTSSPGIRPPSRMRRSAARRRRSAPAGRAEAALRRFLTRLILPYPGFAGIVPDPKRNPLSGPMSIRLRAQPGTDSCGTRSRLSEVRDDAPDLTQRQMAILLSIYLEPPPHTVRGLAAKLNVTKPVITRALDAMGARKLVTRHRDPRTSATSSSRAPSRDRSISNASPT
jgi:hypothetical protein